MHEETEGELSMREKSFLLKIKADNLYNRKASKEIRRNIRERCCT